MIKLPEKALNIGDIGTYIRPRYKARELPDNNAKLFRKPIMYQAGIEPLDNDYLEDLIQKNIVVHKGSEHDTLTSQYHAADVRALYNSLSDDCKTRFTELVKAFELDKENLDMLKGMIVAGGEIRVVASTADVMVIRALTALLGVKLKEFYGTSAGSFQAAGQAVRAPSSSVFTNTVDTNFASFIRQREKLKDWINKFIKEGYQFNTGKEIDIVRGKHIEELGSNLQVLVSENPNWLNLPLPTIRTYFLPNDLEARFGLDYKDFELATAVAASANLIGLFYSPTDLTFGNCFIEDIMGKKHYLFDPGLQRKYQIPMQAAEKGVEQYLSGEINKPPFYFILGNRRVDTSTLEKEILYSLNKDLMLIEKIYSYLSELIDRMSKEPVDKIKEIGIQRAYTEASCMASDPFRPGEVAILNSGNLKVPTHKREVLICANIPRAIDDLHNNLVDKEYINSNGKVGKSPMQLYTNEIDKAAQIKDPSSAIFTTRKESSQVV